MATAATPKKPAGAKAPAARSRAATKVAAVSAASGVPTSSSEAPALAKRPPPVPRKRLSKVFSRPLEKKHKRPVLVRDRYTLPEIEYDFLVALKKRLAANGNNVKKSELLRAGLLLLADLDEAALLALLAKLPPLA